MSQSLPMKLIGTLGMLSLGMIFLNSCGLLKNLDHNQKEEPPKEPKSKAPELVGRIASIPADKRFVLIQSYGKWMVQTGTILTTRGPDNRTANLRATGESLGQFAAADLQSGTVEVGDAVYSRHTPKPGKPSPATATPPELPENEDLPVFENVQKNN